ncbi:MAG: hypothetical protein ABSD75_02075 [Terriglobales bacterium]|jgi:hypothetical protein
MIAVIAFHILILLLGLGVATRAIDAARVSNALGYLHNIIGITTPPPEKVRTIALVWIGTTVVIVDGCLVMLVFMTKLLS